MSSYVDAVTGTSITLLSNLINELRETSPVEQGQASFLALQEFEAIFDDENGADVIELRKFLLTYDIPESCSLGSKSVARMKIWKILLGVPCSFDPNLLIAKDEVRQCA